MSSASRRARELQEARSPSAQQRGGQGVAAVAAAARGGTRRARPGAARGGAGVVGAGPAPGGACTGTCAVGSSGSSRGSSRWWPAEGQAEGSLSVHHDSTLRSSDLPTRRARDDPRSKRAYLLHDPGNLNPCAVSYMGSRKNETWLHRGTVLPRNRS